MRTTRSFFGLVWALLPVLWFGGLLLYFGQVNSWSGGAFDRALGPTMFGLGALTLLFLTLFALKLRSVLAPPRPPAGRAGPSSEERGDFDPDAALARYLARHNPDSEARSVFGRKRD